MPATRETQRSNGMKNIIFNSDKTIWDTGGQQINRRRWTGAAVARTKTGAGGRDSGDRETCAPAVDRGASGLGCGWRGLDSGGTDNGRRWHGKWRQEKMYRSKKKLNRVPVHKK